MDQDKSTSSRGQASTRVNAKLYSAALQNLGKELAQHMATAKTEAENFCKKVRGYDLLELVKRQVIGNQLRELAGRPAIRRMDRGSDQRQNIADLLEKETLWIKALRDKLSVQCVEKISESAGRLVMAAFEEGLLKHPPELWAALRCVDRHPSVQPSDPMHMTSPASSFGASLWRCTVLPCLNVAHPDLFPSDKSAAWASAQESVVACEILADLLLRKAPAGRLHRRRPPAFDPDEDAALAERWHQYRDVHPHGTYKDFVQAAGLEMRWEQVRCAVDRHRHRPPEPTE